MDEAHRICNCCRCYRSSPQLSDVCGLGTRCPGAGSSSHLSPTVVALHERHEHCRRQRNLKSGLRGGRCDPITERGRDSRLHFETPDDSRNPIGGCPSQRAHRSPRSASLSVGRGTEYCPSLWRRDGRTVKTVWSPSRFLLYRPRVATVLPGAGREGSLSGRRETRVSAQVSRRLRSGRR